MSFKLPIQHEQQVTTSLGNEDDDVYTEQNGFNALQKERLMTAPDNRFCTPDGFSQKTSSIMQKHISAHESSARGALPYDSSPSRNTVEKGRPMTNQRQYKNKVDHNIAIRDGNNGAGENDTMRYGSCDDSYYAQQINQLGGIIDDEESNIEVTTIRAGGYHQSIVGAAVPQNLGNHFEEGLQCYQNIQAPKQAHTRNSFSISQSQVGNGAQVQEFFGQRRASQGQKSRATLALQSQASHYGDRKVKFRPVDRAESQQDIREVNQYRSFHDEYNQSTGTIITQTNNKKKRKALHKSIDVEKGESLAASQSNETNRSKRGKNVIVRYNITQAKEDPFETPAVQQFKSDYNTSELTQQNKKHNNKGIKKEMASFTGPKIQIENTHVAVTSSAVLPNNKLVTGHKKEGASFETPAPKEQPKAQPKAPGMWQVVKQKILNQQKVERSQPKHQPSQPATISAVQHGATQKSIKKEPEPIEPAMEESTKRELKIQPKVIEYSNLEEMKKRSAERQSKAGNYFSKNKSKISYLLDDENICTESPSQTDLDDTPSVTDRHEEPIEMNPYQNDSSTISPKPVPLAVIKDDQPPCAAAIARMGDKGRNSLNSATHSYLADKSGNSAQYSTIEEQKTEMGKKQPKLNDPDVNAAYQWTMSGLKVQFKLMFVSNRFQNALNNMNLEDDSLPSEVPLKQPSAKALPPNFEPNFGPTTEVEEESPMNSTRAVEANAQSSQRQEANQDHQEGAQVTQVPPGEAIDFHRDGANDDQAPLSTQGGAESLGRSPPRQKSFSQLLGEMAKECGEEIEGIWQRTTAASKNDARLDEYRFKEFFHQVSKLMSRDGNPVIVEDKYIDQKFAQYKQNSNSSIAKPQIANLVDEMFQDAQLPIKKVKIPKQYGNKEDALNSLMQQRTPPIRYKMWATKNKNILIGGASLEQQNKKKNKRAPSQPYNDYFSMSMDTKKVEGRQHSHGRNKSQQMNLSHIIENAKPSRGSERIPKEILASSPLRSSLQILPAKNPRLEPRLPLANFKSQKDSIFMKNYKNAKDRNASPFRSLDGPLPGIIQNQTVYAGFFPNGKNMQVKNEFRRSISPKTHQTMKNPARAITTAQFSQNRIDRLYEESSNHLTHLSLNALPNHYDGIMDYKEIKDAEGQVQVQLQGKQKALTRDEKELKEQLAQLNQSSMSQLSNHVKGTGESSKKALLEKRKLDKHNQQSSNSIKLPSINAGKADQVEQQSHASDKKVWSRDSRKFEENIKKSAMKEKMKAAMKVVNIQEENEQPEAAKAKLIVSHEPTFGTHSENKRLLAVEPAASLLPSAFPSAAQLAEQSNHAYSEHKPKKAASEKQASVHSSVQKTDITNEEIQQDLGSQKTHEIQDQSKEYVKMYKDYSYNTLEEEERELLEQRADIIKEKDKIIKQLREMENERKDKRHQALEAEKDNLKSDLNELDQLKDLLQLMQIKASRADASRKGDSQHFYGPIRSDGAAKALTQQKSMPASQFLGYAGDDSNSGSEIERESFEVQLVATKEKKRPANQAAAVQPQQPKKDEAQHQTFLTASDTYDWFKSSIIKDVFAKQEKFMPANENLLNEDDVTYLLEVMKKTQMKAPEFSNANLPLIFNKAFKTVEELMDMLNQKPLFEIVAGKYNKINHENAAKLLVRCKSLLATRQLVYKTLKNLLVFEKATKQITVGINNHLNKPTPKNQSDVEDWDRLKSKIAKLPIVSNQIIDNIKTLRDQHRLFSAMVAITSKGTQVCNLMAYKKRDAMRYVVKEYDAIKRLAQVVDGVDALPVITAK